MGRFVEVTDRQQESFLPACLEDYVNADNPVSLNRLVTDYLDIAHLQECDNYVPQVYSGALPVLVQLREEVLVRRIGRVAMQWHRFWIRCRVAIPMPP